MKKLLLLTVLMAVIFTLAISVTPFAVFAEEPEETAPETTETLPETETEIETEEKEPSAVEIAKETLSTVTNDFVVPIVGFLGGLTVVDIVLIVSIVLKSKGKVRMLEAGYTVLKNKLSTAENDNTKLAEALNNAPTVGTLVGNVKAEMTSIISEQLNATIEKGFKNGILTNSETLGNTEIISSKLDCINKALAIVNKNNDAVVNVLAKSPYISTVNKLTNTVTALKQFVTEKTGTQAEELTEYINETLKEVQ